MRLVQLSQLGEPSLTKDLVLNIPPYAILSHTWGDDDDEVTFDDLEKGLYKSKVGHTKLRFCGNQARKDKIDYFWVDTCCINKDNPAELSEAIASMFRWYCDAKRCYVYLSDVSACNDNSSNDQTNRRWESDFQKSRWFTRGWTLQELLAPSSVEFFSREGKLLGNRRTLESQIHEITEIPISSLRGAPLFDFSVDERMRWATKRNTRRKEDKAYCLLGIFNVFMPLIYGEGEHAFVRLREEIYKPSRIELENTRILDWLTSVEYGPEQSDYFNRRQPNTGQWFLESPKYQAWLETSKQTLFCPGIPGAGKTMMTAIVTNDLITRYQRDVTVGIGFIYCNFRRKDDQNLDDLLANLLKQLCRSRSVLPDYVRELYKKHEKYKTRLSFHETLEALHYVAGLYSRVFLIVDALDECQVYDGCQGRFVLMLAELEERHGANIFVTSRIIPDISRKFQYKMNLEISASNDDVEIYCESQSFRFPDFVRHDGHLLGEVKVRVIQAAMGMFLLAKLHLDLLVAEITPTDVREALKTLPTGSDAYGHVYNAAMERICGQQTKRAKLALNVLSWITCARRPLKISELQHALAVELDKSYFDIGKLPPLDIMVSVCAGLITIDRRSDIVRLVHYTAQEFFKRTWKEWFANAESDITTVCVTYLSLRIFESGSIQSAWDFERRLRLNPLYRYAAHYWGHHARAVSTPCRGVLEFLRKAAQVEASSQALVPVHNAYWNSKYGQKPLSGVTALHLAVYFGLEEAVRDLLHSSFDVNVRDSEDRTALFWAAKSGNEGIVKLLVDERAELDLTDKRGRTALSWATQNGHEVVAQFIVERRAAQDLPDEHGRTAFLRAAMHGRLEEIEQLVDKGAAVNLQDIDGGTALSAAAVNNNIRLIKILINSGAALDLRDKQNRTALLRAAELGHEAVVKILIDRGAVLDLPDESGQTPLSNAAQNGHTAAVKLLIDRNAALNVQDVYRRTALLRAAENGHKTIVKLLFDKDASLGLQDKHGRTGLWWAAVYGHKGVVELLVDHGALDQENLSLWPKIFERAGLGNGDRIMQNYVVLLNALKQADNLDKLKRVQRISLPLSRTTMQSPK